MAKMSVCRYILAPTEMFVVREKRGTMTKRIKIGMAVAAGLSCLVFPALLLPLAIVGYVMLGGYGPGFAATAYGVQLRTTPHSSAPPRSTTFHAEEAEIHEHLRGIHRQRAVAWESTPLSAEEESQWQQIQRQWNSDRFNS